MKNPWGDPLLVHQPISSVAVAAFLVSLIALFCAALTFLWPTDGQGQTIYAPAVVVLLVFLQAVGTAVSFCLAYSAFATCRLSDLRSGRGLAWAALAISYGSALWLLVIAAGIWPSLGWATAIVAAIALLHIPAFAAESSFGKQFVTVGLIGGAFLTLASCALLHARENSRIRQCQNNLRQLGLQMMLAADSQVPQPPPAPSFPEAERARLYEQLLDEAHQSDVSRSAPAR